jgi:hypothetical protein
LVRFGTSAVHLLRILKGLRPMPHLLFVLTQKVGKKLKAAFQKPKNYARKLKPCKLDRSATAPPVSNNAWLFTLSSLVFQASETQGLSRDVFISRFKICLQIER